MAEAMKAGSVYIDIQANIQSVLKDLQKIKAEINSGVIPSEENLKKAMQGLEKSLRTTTTEVDKLGNVTKKVFNANNELIKTTTVNVDKLGNKIKETKDASGKLLDSVSTSGKGAEKSIGSMLGQFGGMGGKLGGINGLLGTFDLKMLAIGTGIGAAALGFAKLAEFIGDSVDKAKEAQVELNKIGSLMKGSERAELLPQMRIDLQNLAGESGKTFKDIGEGAYLAISSGIEGKDLSKFMEPISKSAIAGMASTKDVVDVTTSAIMAMGLKTEDTADIQDLFFQAVKEGKVEFTELSAEMGKIMPSLTMGLGKSKESLAQGLAMVTQLTLEGQNAFKATTALQSMFKELRNPEVLDNLKKLEKATGAAFSQGINLETGQIKDLFKFFSAMEKLKLDPKNYALLIQDLEATRALMPLLTKDAETGALKVEQLYNKAFKMDKAKGSMEEAYAVIHNGLDETEKRNQQVWENVQRNVGFASMGMATSFANFKSTVLTGLEDLTSSWDQSATKSFKLGESLVKQGEDSKKLGDSYVATMASIEGLEAIQNRTKEQDAELIAKKSELKAQMDKLVAVSPILAMELSKIGLSSEEAKKKVDELSGSFAEMAKFEFAKGGIDLLKGLDDKVRQLNDDTLKRIKLENEIKDLQSKQTTQKITGDVYGVADTSANIIKAQAHLGELTRSIGQTKAQINKTITDAALKGGLTKEDTQFYIDNAKDASREIQKSLAPDVLAMANPLTGVASLGKMISNIMSTTTGEILSANQETFNFVNTLDAVFNKTADTQVVMTAQKEVSEQIKTVTDEINTNKDYEKSTEEEKKQLVVDNLDLKIAENATQLESLTLITQQQSAILEINIATIQRQQAEGEVNLALSARLALLQAEKSYNEGKLKDLKAQGDELKKQTAELKVKIKGKEAPGVKEALDKELQKKLAKGEKDKINELKKARLEAIKEEERARLSSIDKQYERDKKATEDKFDASKAKIEYQSKLEQEKIEKNKKASVFTQGIVIKTYDANISSDAKPIVDLTGQLLKFATSPETRGEDIRKAIELANKQLINEFERVGNRISSTLYDIGQDIDDMFTEKDPILGKIKQITDRIDSTVLDITNFNVSLSTGFESIVSNITEQFQSEIFESEIERIKVKRKQDTQLNELQKKESIDRLTAGKEILKEALRKETKEKIDIAEKNAQTEIKGLDKAQQNAAKVSEIREKHRTDVAKDVTDKQLAAKDARLADPVSGKGLIKELEFEMDEIKKAINEAVKINDLIGNIMRNVLNDIMEKMRAPGFNLEGKDIGKLVESSLQKFINDSSSSVQATVSATFGNITTAEKGVRQRNLITSVTETIQGYLKVISKGVAEGFSIDEMTKGFRADLYTRARALKKLDTEILYDDIEKQIDDLFGVDSGIYRLALKMQTETQAMKTRLASLLPMMGGKFIKINAGKIASDLKQVAQSTAEINKIQVNGVDVDKNLTYLDIWKRAIILDPTNTEMNKIRQLLIDIVEGKITQLDSAMITALSGLDFASVQFRPIKAIFETLKQQAKGLIDQRQFDRATASIDNLNIVRLQEIKLTADLKRKLSDLDWGRLVQSITPTDVIGTGLEINFESILKPLRDDLLENEKAYENDLLKIKQKANEEKRKIEVEFQKEFAKLPLDEATLEKIKKLDKDLEETLRGIEISKDTDLKQELSTITDRTAVDLFKKYEGDAKAALEGEKLRIQKSTESMQGRETEKAIEDYVRLEEAKAEETIAKFKEMQEKKDVIAVKYTDKEIAATEDREKKVLAVKLKSSPAHIEAEEKKNKDQAKIDIVEREAKKRRKEKKDQEDIIKSVTFFKDIVKGGLDSLKSISEAGQVIQGGGTTSEKSRAFGSIGKQLGDAIGTVFPPAKAIGEAFEVVMEVFGEFSKLWDTDKAKREQLIAYLDTQSTVLTSGLSGIQKAIDLNNKLNNDQLNTAEEQLKFMTAQSATPQQIAASKLTISAKELGVGNLSELGINPEALAASTISKDEIRKEIIRDFGGEYTAEQINRKIEEVYSIRTATEGRTIDLTKLNESDLMKLSTAMTTRSASQGVEEARATARLEYLKKTTPLGMGAWGTDYEKIATEAKGNKDVIDSNTKVLEAFVEYRATNEKLERVKLPEKMGFVDDIAELQKTQLLLAGVKEDSQEIKDIELKAIKDKVALIDEMLYRERELNDEFAFTEEEERKYLTDKNKLLLDAKKIEEGITEAKKDGKAENDSELRYLLKRKQELLKTMQLMGVSAEKMTALSGVEEAISDRMKKIGFSQTTLDIEKATQLTTRGYLPKFDKGGLVGTNEAIAHKGEVVLNPKAVDILGKNLLLSMNDNPLAFLKAISAMNLPSAGNLKNLGTVDYSSIMNFNQTINTNSPTIAKSMTQKGFVENLNRFANKNGLRTANQFAR